MGPGVLRRDSISDSPREPSASGDACFRSQGDPEHTRAPPRRPQPSPILAPPIGLGPASVREACQRKSIGSVPSRTLTYAMSIPSAVPRTAPIAIAPKPPRFPPSRQGSFHVDFSYQSSRSGLGSPESDSPLNGTPCKACQRRRITCVMSEDDDGCVSCQLNGTECSLEGSPQPRKRKLNGDGENYSKRR